MAQTTEQPWFTSLTDLAAERLGGKALECTDDFFAEKENLIKPGRGIFIPDKYTDRGKWMDGWESRRKRVAGHDWCVVQLATTGIIRGVDVDTNHFLGNHPPHCSIEACYAPDGDYTKTEWKEILPKSPLNPGSQNFYEIDDTGLWTHIKLHIYPDGGVARLKVYGEVRIDWSRMNPETTLDLAAAINGARSVACNDMFFSHMGNLIMPGRGINMGDGWETKRNRTPNNRDWVVVKLAHRGNIERIVVDTCHFKGNYPDSCLIEGCLLAGGELEKAEWKPILAQTKLSADAEHEFRAEVLAHEPIDHVRLTIFPDGGVSRMRLFGKIDSNMPYSLLNRSNDEDGATLLRKCCGSEKWVKGMLKERPFRSQEELLEKAGILWQRCGEEDLLEAFRHHPKIGDVESLKAKFASTADWAGKEQGGVQGASEEIIKELARKNSEYETKFGFIFIVCATGKRADEMLEILSSRITNSREQELLNASAEQMKITLIRLNKIN
jgi:allantoicase